MIVAEAQRAPIDADVLEAPPRCDLGHLVSNSMAGEPIEQPTLAPPVEGELLESSRPWWHAALAFSVSLCFNMALMLLLALQLTERPGGGDPLVLQMGLSDDLEIDSFDDLEPITFESPLEHRPLELTVTNPTEHFFELIDPAAEENAREATREASSSSADATAAGILDRLGGVNGGQGGGLGLDGDGGPQGYADFYGQKVRADSVAFVVDASSSMRGAKFDRACDELMYSIQRLEPHQRFAIFFFSDGNNVLQFPSRREMVEATNSWVSGARAWVDLVQAGGNTDARTALSRALQLGPDAVFFLTDGEVWLPEETLRVIDRNRRSFTSVHTIGFEVTTARHFLEHIARENHGAYRYVDRNDHSVREEEAPVESPRPVSEAAQALILGDDA